MPADALASAMISPMAQELDVPDLIRAVEVLKSSGQTQAVVALYAAWITAHPTHPLLYAVLFNYAVTLSDHEQLEAIASRVLVFSRGRQIGELIGAQITNDAITRLCYQGSAETGGKDREAAA